jgi:hypothetical protein
VCLCQVWARGNVNYDNATKFYPSTERDLDLHIEDGEFLVLLARPSLSPWLS